MTDVGVDKEFVEKPVVLATNHLYPSGKGEVIQTTESYSSLDAILGFLKRFAGRNYMARVGQRIEIAYKGVTLNDDGEDGQTMITIEGAASAPHEYSPEVIEVYRFPGNPDLDFAILRCTGLESTGKDQHPDFGQEVYARAPDGTMFSHDELYEGRADRRTKPPEGTELRIRAIEPGQVLFVNEGSRLFTDYLLDERRCGAALESLLEQGMNSPYFTKIVELAQAQQQP